MQLDYGDKKAGSADIGYGVFDIVLGRWGEFRIADPDRNLCVNLELPDGDDPDEMTSGVTLVPRAGRYSSLSLDAEEAGALMAVLTSATEIAEQVNETYADEIAKAREAQRVEKERREKAAKERDEILAARKDQLMTELLGERVKIREAGIKGMRPAIVEVREKRGEYNYDTREYASTGEFEVRFTWSTETDQANRTQNIRRMKRLDVKVGGGWRTVWDDGDDDLSEYDRRTPVGSAKKAPKYAGELGES